MEPYSVSLPAGSNQPIDIPPFVANNLLLHGKLYTPAAIVDFKLITINR